MSETIEIDGSFGEGGGQIVRAALSLSAVTGKKVRVHNIRARRAKPGLARQHLTAARAVAKICGGRLEGADKGSRELTFEPGTIRPGNYSFDIGSAGSAVLVLQTALPALFAAGAPSKISVSGGTHNPMSPPFEHFSECFLPAIALAGYKASARLLRHGFHPKGGGQIEASVEPLENPSPLELTAETDWGGPEPEILIANLPEHVAFRERDELAERLSLGADAIQLRPLPGEEGPGNAVLIRYRAGGRTALVASFGEPRKRAERVAAEGAREAKNFARSRAAADPRLADQLLLPLAQGAGGSFTTSEITEHLRTHAHVIGMFLGAKVSMTSLSADRWLVEVGGAGITG